MKSTIFLDALNQKNTSNKFPIWIMRQAGRYLPNYQQIRQKYPLKTLFTNSEIASKITLMPFEYFNLDAAIVFWDILLIAEPLGFKIVYNHKAPPHAIKDSSDTIEDFDYLYTNIKTIKQNCSLPLIGFCGGPFTVLSFLWKDLKKKIYQSPEIVHQMLGKITEVTIENLKGQIKAGVDAIQIFESSLHMLPASLVKEFSISYIDKITKAISCPTIVFGLGITQHIEEFKKVTCSALGIDWRAKIEKIRVNTTNFALQGNFDPHLLFSSKAQIKQVVEKTLKIMEKDPGWIVNLGHGILPETPLDSVKYFIELVNSYDRLSS